MHSPQAHHLQLQQQQQQHTRCCQVVSSRPRSSRQQRHVRRRPQLMSAGPQQQQQQQQQLAAAATADTGSATHATHAAAQQAVPHAFLRLAHDLADAAALVTSQHFRSSTLNVDSKSDASPVTIADREAEAAMRRLVAARQPAHSVFGEEAGLTRGVGGSTSSSGGGGEQDSWLWVLDPIDGTKSFITGKPLFGTLIALLRNGRPVLGIIDQPITRERWVGVAVHDSSSGGGGGSDGGSSSGGFVASLNGRPLSTRACGDIRNAYLYATTPHMFGGASEQAFNRVRDAVRIPLYGCDCYAYGLLAAGHCDLVCEADLKPYDYMALVPIIQGAGGVITDWRGRPLAWSDVGSGVASAPGEVLAAGDPATHAQALALLDWQQ